MASIKAIKNQSEIAVWNPVLTGREVSLTSRALYVPIKRFSDIFFSFLALSLGSPILILIALIIRLESRGPALYVSKRMGQNKRLFAMLKFRTMYLNSDKILEKYNHLNIYGENQEEIFWKLKQDPRVTPFGKFLRRFNLDELPQFINVLRGDMSIVGNRPLPIYEAKRLIRAGHEERFDGPAGITGLWQIQVDRHDIKTDERIKFDEVYSKVYCFKVDFRILSRTLI